MRSRQPRRRASPTRRPRQRTLIVVGGLRTEVQYFEQVKASRRATGLQVRVIARGVSPSELVEIASREKARDARVARDSGDPRDVFDSVWVVVDVDEFDADIPNAQRAAKESAVRLAVSNPCFEIWLLWHFQDRAAWIHRRDLQRLVNNLNICDGKSIKARDLPEQTASAVERASRARALHVERGSAFPSDNPRSDLDLLLSSLDTS